MFAFAMNNGIGFNLESILEFSHYCHATLCEFLMKYCCQFYCMVGCALSRREYSRCFREK